jgi:hypothetical protein
VPSEQRFTFYHRGGVLSIPFSICFEKWSALVFAAGPEDSLWTVAPKVWLQEFEERARTATRPTPSQLSPGADGVVKRMHRAHKAW